MTLPYLPSHPFQSSLHHLGHLISEYAFPQGAPNKPIPFTTIQATTLLQETLEESIYARDVKAAAQVDDLLNNRTFIFPASDIAHPSLLRHRIYPLLVDLAKNPHSSAFLQALKDVIQRQLGTISFCQFKLNDNQTSQANIWISPSFSRTYEIIFSFGEKLTTALEDGRGKWYIENLSWSRVLFHELVHIHRFAMKRAPFADLHRVRSFYWTNLEEKKTISNGVFSENTWALAHGEKVRITHLYVNMPANKQQQLLTALEWGALGSLEALVREMASREQVDGSLKEIAKVDEDSIPFTSERNKEIYRSAWTLIANQLATEKNKDAASVLLSVGEISEDEVAGVMKFHISPLCGCRSDDDLAMRSHRIQRIRESYIFLISSLYILGKKQKAIKIAQIIGENHGSFRTYGDSWENTKSPITCLSRKYPKPIASDPIRVVGPRRGCERRALQIRYR